jgi:hypothetical protein
MSNLNDVVRDVVQGFVRDGELFTALDVSNKVKETLPLARHREVRDLVRASFTTEIEPAGYARTPIAVTLTDGSQTEALLYHALADSWDLDAKYDAQQRARTASRPVAAAKAAVLPVTSTTPTIPAPPASVAPVTIPAPAGNARGLWDAMFKSQPSLFPLK